MSEWIRKLTEAYSEVNEKKLTPKEIARAAAKGASLAKPKDQVTLKKPPFEIPEDVPVDERDMFMAKAAAAHKAGKSHFTMPGGKKHPVTMKKDTAQAVNSSTNEAHDDKPDDATVRMMKDNPKMRAQDGPGGMKSLERKAHTAVRKALQKKNEEEEVVMNPKKEKKQTQPDMSAAAEAVIYNRIMEARKMKATADKGGEHTKSATDQEEMGDKMASSKGAMDMMNTPKEIKDNPEASGDEVKKAGAAGPKAAMRKGDNAAGDKKIIPSATPMKGM